MIKQAHKVQKKVLFSTMSSLQLSPSPAIPPLSRRSRRESIGLDPNESVELKSRDFVAANAEAMALELHTAESCQGDSNFDFSKQIGPPRRIVQEAISLGEKEKSDPSLATTRTSKTRSNSPGRSEEAFLKNNTSDTDFPAEMELY
jgi:hypothetical protein